jgi:hypothetical protein
VIAHSTLGLPINTIDRIRGTIRYAEKMNTFAIQFYCDDPLSRNSVLRDRQRSDLRMGLGTFQRLDECLPPSRDPLRGTSQAPRVCLCVAAPPAALCLEVPEVYNPSPILYTGTARCRLLIPLQLSDSQRECTTVRTAFDPKPFRQRDSSCPQTSQRGRHPSPRGRSDSMPEPLPSRRHYFFSAGI